MNDGSLHQMFCNAMKKQTQFKITLSRELRERLDQEALKRNHSVAEEIRDRLALSFRFGPSEYELLAALRILMGFLKS